ncbi:hypothetical protein [uncultured Duncaniella sp.]|uniref:hypothetical protein n=1 Tax=uncultured Duncaniella sp. TaxID=2768039 RepID=UPI0026331815|nr:hypothetical protein [uncultured Duncaniella sp.]
MGILYDTLKFYLENESEFEEWLEDAHLNDIDLKRIDGAYPAHYPVLALANCIYIGNHIDSAEVYYAYPEDWTGKEAHESDTDRRVINSAKEFKQWREEMAEEDILLSFPDPESSRPLKYPCLLVSHEKYGNDGDDSTEVMFAYKEDFTNE